MLDLMTAKHIFILVVSGLVIFWGCRSVRTGNTPENQVFKSNDCQTLRIVNPFETAQPGDTYSVEDLKIINNCLQIAISYGGGCGETSFDAFSAGPEQNDYPPQMHIDIVFRDNDPCRSVVADTLFVDLTPYQSLARAGGILIRIKNTDKKVMYALPLH